MVNGGFAPTSSPMVGAKNHAPHAIPRGNPIHDPRSPDDGTPVYGDGGSFIYIY